MEDKLNIEITKIISLNLILEYEEKYDFLYKMSEQQQSILKCMITEGINKYINYDNR